MNDSYVKLVAEWPEDLKALALKNRLPYLHEKARMFVLVGEKKYRKMDFFNQPDEHLTAEEIDIIRQGCLQILEGKGLTEQQPLQNLGVWGFRALMEFFHFEPVERTSQSITLNESDGILDQITFKHLMEDSQITYFNFCSYN